jgi:hypothetical protein
MGRSARVRDGRLRTNIGNVSTLDDAVAAFNRCQSRTRRDWLLRRVKD